MCKMFTKFKTAKLLIVIAVILFVAPTCWGPESKPWSFAVMGDTQWTPGSWTSATHFEPKDPSGLNPNAVSVSIIKQMDKVFIEKGVKFVIQCGDQGDEGTNEGLATAAAARQELYDAGIGYFPMRGNHETYLKTFFPDASIPNNDYCLPAFKANFPQTQGEGNHLFGTYHFSSPSNPDFPEMETELKGMSYAFDYGFLGNNATFVILDPWATPTVLDDSYFLGKDGGAGLFVHYGYTIASQQEWISKRLNKFTRGTEHAFVFAHEPLMAANHVDCPFHYTYSDPDAQNTFYSELTKNNVAFYISAHDHIYYRGVVKSPDGKSAVEEVVSAPSCPKFYFTTPTDNTGWGGQKSSRFTLVSEEKSNIGFYIYTVDGPTVTVEFYADANGNFGNSNAFPDGSGSCITPTFNFVLRDKWSFSLNGKSFMVPQGQSYTSVVDSFCGTTAKILGGINNSTAKDMDDIVNGVTGRAFVKKVNTSWGFDKVFDNLHSEILTLTGMADLKTTTTDTYALSMTCDEKMSGKSPQYILATMNAKGCFVNAVDLNNGGSKKFVNGPYDASYGLGTYGLDKKTNTVWAVVNYNGTFAVKK